MNRALRNPSVRAPARDLLQPLSAGSRAGDPRGPRLRATPSLGHSTAALSGEALPALAD